MKKPFLFLLSASLFLCIQASAAGITFIENKSWKEVLALAKKQNKMIFLDAYAVWCGPCKYLQKEVFTNTRVGAYYNTNFINVKMDMEKGEGIDLSQRFEITSYPTLFFINGDGKLVHKAVGAMEVDEFIALGKDALDPAKQYYTVKAQAMEGKIKPAVLHDWIHAADAMEETGTDEVVGSYLAAARFPLIEKEMLSVIVDHGSGLSKPQLDELFANRDKAAELLGTTTEDIDDALVDLVAQYASGLSASGSQMDFDKLQKIVASYYPARSVLETRKAKVSYYIQQEDAGKALSELTALLQDRDNLPDVADMATSVMDAVPLIVEANRGEEFVKKVQAYELMPSDTEFSYYKDLALLVLHYRMQDTEKIKLYANKILKNKQAPEPIINLVKGMLE